jgi:hypothetical protein
MLDPANARQPAHDEPVQLVRLEILDEIGQDERAARMMKKLDFRHVAAGNGKGRNLRVPRVAAVISQRAAIEVDAAAGPLPGSRGQMNGRVRKPRLPLGNSPIMEPVWSDDPAGTPGLFDLGPDLRDQGCRRMDEQITARPLSV